MDRQEVITKIVEAVGQVQEASGRTTGQIGVSTRPMKDLDGFDSLSGVEATVVLSDSLGFDLPGDYNPFVSKDGRRALSIGEIAERIYEFVEGEAKS